MQHRKSVFAPEHEVAVEELPPAYRPVVLLRDIEELSTEDTAQVLGLTVDVVKTRLHRARAAMRQKLDCYLNNRCVAVRPIASPPPLSETAWEDLRKAWGSVTGVTAG